MMIDFHTHLFPDTMAEKTICKMEAEGNTTAFTRGTLTELKRSMKENNIDLSVVLPVVTKPSQFDTINQYAAQIDGKEGIISFGGIHPKMVRIIQFAVELDLIVVLHAGIDIGLPTPVHCPPNRASNMLARIENNNAKIILAHTGGYEMWDEVEEYLVGMNVWLDTSYSMNRLSEEQFTRIVRNHGADRILFATDSPWGGQKETAEWIKGMDLTEEEQERIFWKNGAELLGYKT